MEKLLPFPLQSMTVRGQGRHWCVSAAGAVFAVALHALFIAPLVLEFGGRKNPVLPDMQGAGASALRSTAQAPTSMTLVDLSSTRDSDEPPLEDLASLGIELPKTDLVIASADSNPAFTPLEVDETLDSDTTQAAGDTQGQAAMFGRYLGQVSARIERAWMRPRNAIGAPRFNCETKIEQDRDGRVLSVELRQCNGDVVWQRSLINAIQRASPLPAPPVPSVFANFLTLDFSAEPFRPGKSDGHAYEPEILVAEAADSSMPTEFSDGRQTRVDVSRFRGAVELRIEGSKVMWIPREPSEGSVELGAPGSADMQAAKTQR